MSAGEDPIAQTGVPQTPVPQLIRRIGTQKDHMPGNRSRLEETLRMLNGPPESSSEVFSQMFFGYDSEEESEEESGPLTNWDQLPPDMTRKILSMRGEPPRFDLSTAKFPKLAGNFYITWRDALPASMVLQKEEGDPNRLGYDVFKRWQLDTAYGLLLYPDTRDDGFLKSQDYSSGFMVWLMHDAAFSELDAEVWQEFEIKLSAGGRQELPSLWRRGNAFISRKSIDEFVWWDYFIALMHGRNKNVLTLFDVYEHLYNYSPPYIRYQFRFDTEALGW